MRQTGKTIQIYFINKNPQLQRTIETVCGKNTDAYTLLETGELDDKNDAIIVSGIAELTNRWIFHLISCAESYVNVGTVSPLTKRELELELKGKSPVALATAFEVCGEQLYPEVKYNLFDCVYIKKEVFDEAGVPSTEEMLNSDKSRTWFKRAAQMGWKHRICTQALFINGFLYPPTNSIYTERIDFLFTEILQKVQKNLQLYMEMNLDNGKKNVLHFLLADFQEGTQNNVGGTQFHVSDLVLYEKNVYNVFVLARDGELLRLTEYSGDITKVFTFYIGKIPEYNVFFDEAHEKLYDYILAVLRIDLVHVHHTMWMPLNIYYSANKLRIPIALSIHDYYYACPVLKMLDMDGQSCSRESCRENCDVCLKNNKNIDNGGRYLKKWYKEHSRAISLCRQIIFPSEHARNVLSNYYPIIKEKSTVIEHGIVLPVEKSSGNFAHDRLRVAFIGGISDVKGGPIIYDLITQDKKTFDWYLMGGIAYLKLYHLEQENLTKTGWYKRYEIYDLLRMYEIDLVCILSTVEETYCYTLSEAVAAGIPVVATNVGALGQRMQRLQCGWIIPKTATAKDILSLLFRIKEYPSEYHAKYEKTIAAPIKDLEEMGKEYDELYSKIMSKILYLPVENMSFLRESFYSGTDKNDVELRSKEEQAQLLADQRELNELKNSLLVKCALELRKVRIPGKEKIKERILNLRRKRK